MADTLDLSLMQLGFLYLFMAVPLLLLSLQKVPLIKDTLISIVRMSVQLSLVGVYLSFLYRLNHWALNILWILIMIVVASGTIIKRAGLRGASFFLPLLGGTFLGFLITIGFFLMVVVRVKPFYNARYLIPLSGMIMGNCLKSNVLALERFYSELRKTEKVYSTYLLLGATRHEALQPYMREALKAAMGPTVASMMTIGLVSLPGMMTGQMLGGSIPATAIKYQIAIMMAIFSGETLSCWLNLHFSRRTAFTAYDRLRRECFP
ncbi:MAG: iron export ABC transporter permease subunit FetB [Spirochaetales bacterium]|nr:iron export ABC transporter permease subunit FetB [Spirochaetales bacterium]